MGWGGGQDGCERRIKVFVKIQTKNLQKEIQGSGEGQVGGLVGRGSGLGGQGRCNRGSEVFLKIQKKIVGVSSGGGGGGGSGRVDVNEELKFLVKFHKTNSGGSGCSGLGC